MYWVNSRASYWPTGEFCASISSLWSWRIVKFESYLLVSRFYHEKDLIDLIVTPFFCTIPFDSDVVVRKAVIEFLLRISRQCSNTYKEPILHILERVSNSTHLIIVTAAKLEILLYLQVIHTPFDDDDVAERCQKDPSDVQITLEGLIEIFAVSIHQLPSSNAKKVLSMLVKFLMRHYDKPQIFESVIGMRLMVCTTCSCTLCLGVTEWSILCVGVWL